VTAHPRGIVIVLLRAHDDRDLAEALAEDLPATLREQVADHADWRMEVCEADPADAAASSAELVDAMRRRLLQDGAPPPPAGRRAAASCRTAQRRLLQDSALGSGSRATRRSARPRPASRRGATRGGDAPEDRQDQPHTARQRNDPEAHRHARVRAVEACGRCSLMASGLPSHRRSRRGRPWRAGDTRAIRAHVVTGRGHRTPTSVEGGAGADALGSRAIRARSRAHVVTGRAARRGRSTAAR
jgi:hypothetical protein